MTDTLELEISKRRDAILAELAAAAAPPPVLIAVSKTQPDAAIEAMLAAGQRVFGENRVQEAAAHWQDRRDAYPDLELHLIGPLQTNKSEDAVRLFDVIQTLDRPKLADTLAAAMAKTGRRPRLFIQVNTGEEPQKAGVTPAGLAALLDHARNKAGLEIDGLMCIPPVGEPAGPHFALLAKLAQAQGLSKLSMGMSGDYVLAARYGATHVRVGTALFGERAMP
ncbi:YggS family pyridoxal phosphate-dependent enzyme [Hyphomonas sp.]|uniref:YggS family pyridoxal phosphate-dependent enzyme n=1 Tax=Hyphomonas sp. TaxID=87 RepID=UPI0025C627AB|nr:YggS family pyridoxal phosphate-dependent enzyme [Hyphomonas sp.]MBI1399804.1 YggS family pyridoxal phosphate-dependent enzyme [Hyphomonas sp.]